MALVQLSDQVSVLPGGVNIGVVRLNDRQVALIDSGLNDTPRRRRSRPHDRSSARRSSLSSPRTGTRITSAATRPSSSGPAPGSMLRRSTRRSCAIPSCNQPSFMAGPTHSIRCGPTSCWPTRVRSTWSTMPGRWKSTGSHWRRFRSAGHSGNQMGILVDGVFFAADVVLPESILEKYRIPYLYSVTDHLRALELAWRLRSTHCTRPRRDPGRYQGPSGSEPYGGYRDRRSHRRVLRSTADQRGDHEARARYPWRERDRFTRLLPAPADNQCVPDAPDPNRRLVHTRYRQTARPGDAPRSPARSSADQFRDLIAEADAVVRAAVLWVDLAGIGQVEVLERRAMVGNFSR